MKEEEFYFGAIEGEIEICNECGKSVKFGTGLYVNRVPDFNGYDYRIEMLKPFPEGDFMCAECEEEINQIADDWKKSYKN